MPTNTKQQLCIKPTGFLVVFGLGDKDVARNSNPGICIFRRVEGICLFTKNQYSSFLNTPKLICSVLYI